MSLEQAVAVVVPAVMALGWLFRIESRVNNHEATCEERMKRLDERHKVIDEHHQYFSSQLAAINIKLDRLVESRHFKEQQ